MTTPFFVLLLFAFSSSLTKNYFDYEEVCFFIARVRYGACHTSPSDKTSGGFHFWENSVDGSCRSQFEGVPAFVFYLDQSGEHGLAMSIPAFDAKGGKNVDAGFRKLRCEMVKLSGKHWLEIFDRYSGQDPLVCAVHDF